MFISMAIGVLSFIAGFIIGKIKLGSNQPDFVKSFLDVASTAYGIGLEVGVDKIVKLADASVLCFGNYHIIYSGRHCQIFYVRDTILKGVLKGTANSGYDWQTSKRHIKWFQGNGIFEITRGSQLYPSVKADLEKQTLTIMEQIDSFMNRKLVDSELYLFEKSLEKAEEGL